MEFLAVLFRNVSTLLFYLFPFVPIICYVIAAREVPNLIVAGGRCENKALLFLIAPFKWARDELQLDDSEFDYARIAFDPFEALTVTLGMTGRMVLTVALFPLIGPMALVVRTLMLKRP